MYEHLGTTTKEEFEALAKELGTGVHTYLSDGDRGHRCWAFYYGHYKYVTDGLRYGRKLDRDRLPPGYQNNGDGTFSMDW